MVHKEIWAHLLAYNLLRTAMAVAAARSARAAAGELQGGQAGGDGVRPEDRGGAAGGSPGLIDALLMVIAYHRVGNRPRRWEPRATKRRPKPRARLGQTTSRGQPAGESLEMVLS